MTTVTRATILFAWIAGWVLTIGLQLGYPIFYSSPVQLVLIPVALSIAAMPIGFVAGRLRRGRADRADSGRRSPLRRALPWVAPVAVSLVVFATQSGGRNWTVEPRVLVFAIDGATWTVARPLMETGEMPEFQALAEGGTIGTLRSIEPSYSPVIWTTIATGLNPNRHGVLSFYSTQGHLRAKRLWEVLQEYGLETGIFRWWVTWPPRSKNGFLIPGILARDGRAIPAEYEFVNSLRIQIKGGGRLGLLAALGYVERFLDSGLRLDTGWEVFRILGSAAVFGDYADRHVAMRKAEILLNAAVFGGLLRETEPDLAAFYDNGVDVVSHYYWRYFEPEAFDAVNPAASERYAAFVPDFYRLVDRVLGELRTHLGESTRVVVLSDHGLEASGVTKEQQLRPRVKEILEQLGVADRFYGIALGPESFVESVSSEVDVARNQLVEIEELLAAARIVETGKPLLETTWREDGRLQVSIAAGVSEGQRAVLGGRDLDVIEVVEQREGMSGTHSPDGILLVHGPGIRRGQEIRGAHVYDIAPSILYLMGAPVAEDLDGRILEGLFTDRQLESRPARMIGSYGEVEPVAEELELDPFAEEVLRSLGYVN